MIEIQKFDENEIRPPATNRSVVVFFNDGSIIVVPDFAFNPEDETLKSKAHSYMYFPEGEMHYYIWAVVIASMNVFNQNTVESIANEKIEDKDFFEFFRIMAIKYKMIDEITISLESPSFNRFEIDQWIIKGKPWTLGVISYIRENLDEFGKLLN